LGTLGRSKITIFGILLLLLLSFSYYPIHSYSTHDNIVYLENGLHLTGEENQTLETNILIISGNIKLSGNARLRIINCNLTLLQNPGISSQRIEISESSKLELINTTINKSAGLKVEDNGILIVRNTTITSSSHIWLQFKDNSTLSFINSSCQGKAPQSSLHWGTEDMLPEGALREYWDDYRFSFEDTSSISIQDSMVGEVNVYQNSSCKISDSYISLLHTSSSVETVVENSDIKVLSAKMTDTIFEHTGNIEGYHQLWTTESYFGTDNKNNLRLIETSFDNLWLILSNCVSNIHDAQLFYLSSYHGDTTVIESEIKFLKLGCYKANVLESNIEYLISTTIDKPVKVVGSTLGFLGLSGQEMIDAIIIDSKIIDCRINNFFMPDLVTVRFDNVKINDLWLNPVDQFDLYFNKSEIHGNITLLRYRNINENASIHGSLSFSPESSLKHYANTALTREYTVQVISDGIPQSGVPVQLIKNGEIWREYITDNDGKIWFKIKWVDYSKQDYFPDFHPNNLTQSIVITTSNSDESISILSDTPIILETVSPSKNMIPVTIGIVTLLIVTTLFMLKKRT